MLTQTITPWLPGLGTLEHAGRKSGKRYRTPLLVFETNDGYAILIGYGMQTDWLKNVLAGGPTLLHKRGRVVALINPRVVGKQEAAALVTPSSRLLFQRLSVQRGGPAADERRPGALKPYPYGDWPELG